MLSKLFSFDESGKRMLPEAVKVLKEDFRGENADARPDEELRRTDYEIRIREAKKRASQKPRDVEARLQCAEAHGILDPEDKECLAACEECLRLGGIKKLDLQRQGDFWALYGRSLFLADRFDEALLSFISAKDYYAKMGNKLLRKRTNCGLLRTYAALGKSKLAAERLEVALTMCEELDEICLLYMHAKHSLEQTGNARDVEVLDDIWYCELDINKPLRDKFEEFESMSKNVLRSTAREDDDENKAVKWDDVSKGFRRALTESYRDQKIRVLVMVMVGSLLFLVTTITALTLKNG